MTLNYPACRTDLRGERSDDLWYINITLKGHNGLRGWKGYTHGPEPKAKTASRQKRPALFCACGNPRSFGAKQCRECFNKARWAKPNAKRCAKCDEPRRSTSGYCQKHQNEYSRARWQAKKAQKVTV